MPTVSAITSTLILVMSLLLLTACSSNGNDPLEPRETSLAVFEDPGTGPWETVAREDLVEECGLDPDILDTVDATAAYSYAVVRHGKLCHEFYRDDMPGRDEPANNFSSTKTLAAAIVGRAVKLSADLPRPLKDTDRMDAWVGDITFNTDALIVHVLAMLGYNESLEFGQRSYAYDASGRREINRLSDVVEAVMAQKPERFSNATTTGEFAQREFFDRLGMDNSFWDGESFGSTWHSDLRDLARLGLFLAHDGVWDQRRLVEEDWIYKMRHPAFEDANTAYGYLTWMSASKNYYLPGFDLNFQVPLSTCQPDAVWPSYPHGLSESTDCNFEGEYSCEQVYDVGVFGGAGAGGQLVVVHKGLDLVLVTRNAGNLAFLHTPWDLVRPALVAHDAAFMGDEEAFCEAYRAGEYAPNLLQPEGF